MYEQLPMLLGLQDVDNEIDKFKRQRDASPIKLKQLDIELQKYKEIYESKNKVLEEILKLRRDKERTQMLQQHQLQKYRAQQLTVKTNKEYTALEIEITELKEAISKTEDEILELMISADEATNEVQQAKEQLQLQERVIQAKKEEVLSEIKQLDDEIAKWMQKRQEYINKIDNALMERYNAWRKRRGSSLVSVITDQACGECHMTLPPQLINEVRKKERIYTCTNCGRILYWKEQEDVQEQKET